MKRTLQLIFLVSLIVILVTQCQENKTITPTNKLTREQLGKLIFFDHNLSNPGIQSCASCHAPSTGFSDPSHSIVSAGAADNRFANRNAPAISYAKFTPSLSYNKEDETYVGGFFLDGRVNTLKEQAKKPFFNPLEMNITSLEMFASKIKSAAYYSSLIQLYGTPASNEQLLDFVADALAAYESSEEVNPFTSKFDYYLQGKVSFTALENEGFDLFKNKAQCANCHLTEPDTATKKVLLTDYTYDNLGVPKNPYNPYYYIEAVYNKAGAAYLDSGLAGTTKNEANLGQFKVPTLRNIAVTGPYFHNGVYGTLEEVVHFYNSRDVDPSIAAPEINRNINREELGNLKLSPREEQALVAFLRTLTDGWK